MTNPSSSVIVTSERKKRTYHLSRKESTMLNTYFVNRNLNSESYEALREKQSFDLVRADKSKRKRQNVLIELESIC